MRMKKTLLLALLGITAMALIPLIGAAGLPETGSPDISGTDVSVSQISKEQKPDNDNKKSETVFSEQSGNDYFRIFDTSQDRIVTIDDREFCIGALAYEMPAGYEKEALKAQCVACYTYFCRQREIQREKGEQEDIRADLSKGQYYLSPQIIQERWGGTSSDGLKRLAEAVDEVFGQTLRTNDGHLAQVAYFAVSSGVTENAEDIFGSECAVLKAVASPYDLEAPGYCTKKTVSRSEFIKTLSGKDSAFNAGKSGETVGEVRRTASGSVLGILIGGVEWKGGDLRKWFGLRSADFDLAEGDEGFTFTVRGYGHGVGMSQYGANAMAEQGSDYREILMHYYRNCALSP